MVRAESREPVESPRLVEIVAAFSLAAALGLGQEMDHGLRSCLIASRLAEPLELAESDRGSIYWVSLLAMVGCTADSFELRRLFGDDIALRAGMYDTGTSDLAMARYFLSRAGSDGGLAHRARTRVELVATGMRAVVESLASHCQVTGRLADRLGLGPSVSGPLQHTFARWDGKGSPKGLSGGDIAVGSRVYALADTVEVHHRRDGVATALARAREQSGSILDPALVDAFLEHGPSILETLEETSWDAVVACEPGARPRLSGERLDDALQALGDFADLKSPWFTGHSRRTADLAAAAATRAGHAVEEVREVRQAAFVHALGRAGVPNTIWDSEGPLTVAQRERMQLHAYYTDRILRRGSLAGLAELASSTQERLDGSGYPRGLRGSSIPSLARLLAAADVYDALTHARPHRPARSPEEAAGLLRRESQAGRLAADAVETVLGAAGHVPERRATIAPDDLTPREVEVLRLIARGQTNAQVAHALSIKVKTVGSHIEHIYTKIGASNRSVATLYAMEHGLL
jgi:HD-GYP domain-containing protein (c-di-GMP phosphodiesterase class II)